MISSTPEPSPKEENTLPLLLHQPNQLLPHNLLTALNVRGPATGPSVVPSIDVQDVTKLSLGTTPTTALNGSAPIAMSNNTDISLATAPPPSLI